MKEDTAKKARRILDKLEHYRTFLVEYDECKTKIITVKRDPFPNIQISLDFSCDKNFESMVRELVVCKIRDLEKELGGL